MALEHIDPLVNVTNLKKTVDWYSGVLGFKVTTWMPDEKKPQFARMERDGTAIMFGTGADPMSGKAPGKAVKDAVRSRQARHVWSLYIRTNNLRTELNRARKAGAKITREPLTQPYGMREFAMQDPNGYEVVLGQNLL